MPLSNWLRPLQLPQLSRGCSQGLCPFLVFSVLAFIVRNLADSFWTSTKKSVLGFSRGVIIILSPLSLVSANKPVYLEKCDPVESVTDVETRLPWWLECNRARFPYWYGAREPRLVALYDALQHPEAYSLDTITFPEWGHLQYCAVIWAKISFCGRFITYWKMDIGLSI